MNRKVVIGILLFLSLLFAGVIVYGQIKIRQVEKARQEAQEAVVFKEMGVREEVQVTPSPLPEEMGEPPILKEPPPGLSLASPVEKKYFEKALIDEGNPQVISFFLEPGEAIKAIFKGKIRTVFKDQRPFSDDNPFDEVILDKEDGQFYASFIIFGEVLVNEGDIIEKGQVIAKAKEGGLGFRSMTNLSLWLHDKEGELIALSKEMFK